MSLFIRLAHLARIAAAISASATVASWVVSPLPALAQLPPLSASSGPAAQSTPPATQPAGAVVVTDQVRAELLAHAPRGVGPGLPLWLGLKIEHRPHWHTYWKNPGDSGQATSMNWTLPSGASAGEIQWPLPQRQPVGPLMNYGYDGTLLLQVPVTVAARPSGEVFEVALEADWLVCKEVCIPENGKFVLRVPLGGPVAGHAALFDAARARVPQVLAGAKGRAELVAPPASAASGASGGGGAPVAASGEMHLQVTGLPAAWQGKPLLFLPESKGVVEDSAKVISQWPSGATPPEWRARVVLSAQRSESPATMRVVLAPESAATGSVAAEPVAVVLDLPVAGTWPAVRPPGEVADAAHAAAAASLEPPPHDAGWLAALGLALLGGAILNLMPCVFPVLSLKVLGFAAHARDRRALLAGGLAYAAGVVASFVALAGLLLALRAGGEQLGWGFQLQSPLMVAALAALFTVIGLNLVGVFEFGTLLPGNLAGVRLTHPLADSALTGVLAVAIASPCTAPFMGASLGAAATLPAPQALSVFAALGLGMALPYLLLCAWPALTAALPRPGAWMAHLRTVMAFPMFATVVWLLWVLGQQTGLDGAIGLLGVLVALAFAAWVGGHPSLGPRGRWLLGLLAAATLAATLAWALPAWRSQPEGAVDAAPSGVGSNVVGGDAAAPRWQAWSPARVADLHAQGRTVFVDFTAAWCVTCQFNKRTVFSDAQVLAAFDARRVVLLRADWTRRDPAITAELTRLGRNGVPVYAFYTPGAGRPRLMSELPTAADLREALAALP